MRFKGLEKSSLIEWPGRIVAVAYTGGCNFRCPYCQNSDLVLRPEGLPDLEGDEVIEYLRSRRKWVEGLVVTGGEPTIHPPLPDFARKVKGEGFGFGLETNGSNPHMLRELIRENFVDFVALDIKAPLKSKRYREVTGVEEDFVEEIRESMRTLRGSNVDYEYRTTVVPNLLSKRDLNRIAEQIRADEKFFLQQFVPQNTLDDDYENLEPYPREKLEEIKNELTELHSFRELKVRNL